MQTTTDAPGPDHTPVLSQLAIDGVFTEQFPSVAYKQGTLTEVVNSKWQDLFSEPVEHLYFISNSGDRVREEWYVHHKVLDRYVLIDGKAKVALFDDRESSPTFETLIVVDLAGIEQGGVSGLRIPAGVWHSFSYQTEKLLLMNAKHPGYNRDEPDKFRMPMPNERTNFHW